MLEYALKVKEELEDQLHAVKFHLELINRYISRCTSLEKDEGEEFFNITQDSI